MAETGRDRKGGDDATPHLGVLMLDTRFPRLRGDIGNPASFACPVSYHRVPSATVARIATAGAHPLPAALADAFVGGTYALVARGATHISTSCGFLLPLQDRLAREAGRPVVASALTLLPVLRAQYGPDAVIGVVTFDADALEHMALDDLQPLAVAGLDRTGTLYRAIREDLDRLDEAEARREAVAAALALARQTPRPAALVLECTNLSPYRGAIAHATGLPVHDIATAIARAMGVPVSQLAS